MLSQLVGQVSAEAALVLVAMTICVGVIITSLIVKRRSRLALEHEFELEKIKQADAHAQRMASIQGEREYKMGQLNQNLITSHKVTPPEQ